MKKLLAFILCLFMLPLCALAEAAPQTENWVTVDLGDFTMQLLDTDVLQRGVKEEGQILFIAYTRYDESNTMHPNINAAWTQEKLTGIETATQDELDAFGNQVIKEAKTALLTQGVKIENETLLSAQYAENGGLILYYSMDYDYTALGIDLATTLYQMQIYIDVDDGTYAFTLTGPTPETILDQLDNYFATIQFEE